MYEEKGKKAGFIDKAQEPFDNTRLNYYNISVFFIGGTPCRRKDHFYRE